MSNLTINTSELQTILNLLEAKMTGFNLPTLDNEGTAADILEGKEFIDSQGNKIVGTLSNDLLNMILDRSITTAIIPSTITKLGDYVFCNCTQLASVTIPETVNQIGFRAFYSCTNLTSISLPSQITSIAGQAFNLCDNLTTLTCLAVTPPYMSTNALPSALTAIYVPSESVARYQAATNWSTFAEIIQAIPT